MSSYKKIKKDNGFIITFPSCLAFLEDIVAEAVAFVKSKDIELDFFAFRLALYEGLSNAVNHGNKSDINLNVVFEFKLCDGDLFIAITDSGDGFDWGEAMRKAIQDCDKPSGRGIMLMKAYGYHPSYNSKGNVLTFSKKLDAPDYDSDVL